MSYFFKDEESLQIPDLKKGNKFTNSGFKKDEKSLQIPNFKR
jgi:hypothetical protein